MEKVKLTKAQADALEIAKSLKAYQNDISSLLIAHISHSGGECWAKEMGLHPLNHLDVETFARAVIVGYEVEMTPEEKVREKYESVDPWETYGNAYRQAIRDTLNILGIKIEGVNA
ncbi:hypothetical protein P4S93_18305 [Aneurinibacillus thermoaerophilus]|uniref:Uncharacterized protein n=1 Tax=Aneurinibacillus thermoaerophilus TaxID=143495 RepID=A0A1G8FTY2_ANETH|nr:hypothetical protein [Aneurinibacillus thermoaerophilus]MED0759107.1 hypothetical protein [Aneurinibacillus thermoaerophilus]MED0762670.1 hypothetical protein [Aneurinibacillus thermoaerophilus]SDH85599.1 hypothetical protein SAMN04489735_10855 [Aneurinibacillus thermoaerophilus]